MALTKTEAYQRRRTGAYNIARSEIYVPTQDWRGMCLKFIRMVIATDPGASSAIGAWSQVAKDDRHGGVKPILGVPVFWDIGKHGHVALSVGGGECISTDILRTGRVDRVGIDYITTRWGATYLGWSETLNGVRVLEVA